MIDPLALMSNPIVTVALVAYIAASEWRLRNLKNRHAKCKGELNRLSGVKQELILLGSVLAQTFPGPLSDKFLSSVQRNKPKEGQPDND